MTSFGEIPGIAPRTGFPDRRSLHDAGVHRTLRAGIVGSAADGAESIVVSGGYEDDEDYGDVIIYTGHGGNDPDTGQQIVDQQLERGNKALAVSCDAGIPCRLSRTPR